MSLSYIPYVKVDSLERLDLQTLNNTFEKLYLNDLFYSEIDRIAPKIFINGATYEKGDCVWYNTEDPREFVLSSNVHWRLIKYQINEQDLDGRYPMASKYDLLSVISGEVYPNTVEWGGQLSRSDWNILSGEYLDAISCAYDIGDITKPVQIYQYLGDRSVLNIPTTRKIRYSDQKYLLSAYYPETAAKAETKTFDDLSIYMDESATISVETELGEVVWKTLSAGCSYQLKPMSMKMPIYTTDKFYQSNWKPLLDSPVERQDIVNYVLNRIEEHVNADLSSDIYRDHTTAHGETLSTFQVEYLNNDFSNISDDICQMDIPNLTFDDDHNMNTGFDYVYETVIDGDRGYRLWKSGLLEHWGKLVLDENDFQGLSGSAYGYKVNLNWTYNAPDQTTQKSKTYTYGLSNNNTTNSNLNSTINVYGESEYLLADDNRYQVMYTWSNSGWSDGEYYKKILGAEYTNNTDTNIINFTECNVYNVKNTSFTIPNISYLLNQTVDEGYVHHLHPTLFYYTSGFTRHTKPNMYNKREKIIVYDLDELMLGGSFDSAWRYTGSAIKPQFQLTKNGIVIVGSGGTHQYHIGGKEIGAETQISRDDLTNQHTVKAISSYTEDGETYGCFLREGIPSEIPLSDWEIADNADYVDIKTGETTSQHFAWDDVMKTWIELNDYIYRYENNVDATRSGNPAKIVVQGLYECGISQKIRGYREFTFQILPIDGLECIMSFWPKTYKYTSEEITPNITIYHDSDTIPESNYYLEYQYNKNVGTAIVNAHFYSNNLTGSIGDTFEIEKRDISECSCELSTDWLYSGKEIKPPVDVTLEGNLLKEGVDYRLQYNGATDVGEGWPVRVLGINNLSGYTDLSFNINKVDLSEGKSEPEAEIFIGWVASGTQRIDQLSGIVTVENGGKETSTGSQEYVYGVPAMTMRGPPTVGYEKTYTLVVAHNGTKLQNGKDYIVEMDEELYGKESTEVTIHGIGNYTGTFETKPVPVQDGFCFKAIM